MNNSKKENYALILSTIILGIIVGISSLILILLLNTVEINFLHFKETALNPVSLNILPSRRLLSVFSGGIIAALVWWILRTKFKPAVSVAKGTSGTNMPFFQTVAHVMTQIFYVGTGGSIGREVAPREAGAMFAQKCNHFFNRCGLELSLADQKLLIAAAAGAGFAGVYSAPITGMFFCLEVLLKKITKRAIAVSLIMSIIATLISATVKGFGPYYLIGGGNFSLVFLLFVVLSAPLCSISGTFFRRSFKWAEKNQNTTKKILWTLPSMALITGIFSMSLPIIMGNGRALTQTAINTNIPSEIMILLIAGLVKAFLTVFTIQAGASGGTLTPSISIGASLGVIFGFIFKLLIPGISLWQCALSGGCSFLAASQQAPLMALFMIVEISHLNYAAFLPLGLGAALSISISKIILHKKNS
ncbi:chloride channel protein [Liquorilactobacillus oeni]|uniref:Chloride channel protein n=1 Tax=Liquorilactobacillus oeni DSM 19972 TaxID=1423777 RepID=A0A0R1MMA8_9LACO|nr:chloride channel protein [Liquorilactobacillus oeni]KRL05176.1 hypothetical protein FD46_GL001127 [Liquorilactobacillus oeni DSM 19972]